LRDTSFFCILDHHIRSPQVEGQGMRRPIHSCRACYLCQGEFALSRDKEIHGLQEESADHRAMLH
jgi:hypothetical protein